MPTDLAKALESAIGANDDQQEVGIWLDTGFKPLNKAISSRYDGGAPSSRIIEIFGGESCGKCLTKDTMLLSEHGLVTLEEFFKMNGHDCLITNKEVEVQAGLLNEKGEIEQTSHFTFNGKRKIVHLITSSGKELKTTYKHPIRVINDMGHIVWRMASDIDQGDTVLAMNMEERPRIEYPSDIDKKEAKFIGYLVADGAMSDKNAIRFSNSDSDIVADFGDAVYSVIESDKEWEHRVKGGTTDHRLCDTKERQRIYEKYGLDYVVAKDKTVPLCIRAAEQSCQIEFLRAYLEVEGHFSSSRSSETLSFEVTSASKKLLSQVQLMLSTFGILSTLAEKKVKGYEQNEYWRLYVGGRNTWFLIDLIKPISSDVNERIAKAKRPHMYRRHDFNEMLPNCVSKLVQSLYESVPPSFRVTEVGRMVKDLSKPDAKVSLITCEQVLNLAYTSEEYNHSVAELIEAAMKYNYETVVSVEFPEEKEPVFDVCLPDTHSFWSNGLVSHNTAIATQIMISAQKMGGIACFMDHERSFALPLAEKMGLETEGGKWVFKTPDTFEKSMVYANTIGQTVREKELIDADAPIVMVFDSLASMVPQQKLDKAADEMTMNDNTALARCTSSAFPALAMICEKYNMLAIFLNQIRDKIGVMYGDKTTSPGGNAPRFYASVRIKLTRSQITSSDKKTKIGQKVTAECIKNKVSAPFQVAQWDFLYMPDGSGKFDVIGSSIDHCVEVGLLKTPSKGYIEWNGKKYRRNQLKQLCQKDKSEWASLNALMSDV